MISIRKYKIGSQVFFDGIEGFTPKDIDELNIMDSFPFSGNVLHTHINGKDVFFFRNMNKEEFIEDTLNSNVPMRAGKFLVPEFAANLGMTIEDLKRLRKLFYSMDKKHEYEKIIYQAYLKNKSFRLTDGQRKRAYEVYKKYR